MERREFVIALLAMWAANGAGCGGQPEPLPSVDLDAMDTSASTFHRIYDDVGLRDRFFKFLQNVFNLYPDDKFHQLIIDVTQSYGTDAEIYQQLLDRLPSIAPVGGMVTYALPALKKQKQVMTEQSVVCLHGLTRIDGYLEIGTTGRYLKPLAKRIPIDGTKTIVNDMKPTYGPADMVERGRVLKAGSFVDLANYAPFDSSVIEPASMQVVSNLIGFHHCPDEQLEGFITTIRQTLKPKGRLLLREHNVVDATMDAFVALAHDVFNAGVAVTWADNQSQFRHFRSVAAWHTLLQGHGFVPLGVPQYQAHDPTDNAMLCFEAV